MLAELRKFAAAGATEFSRIRDRESRTQARTAEVLAAYQDEFSPRLTRFASWRTWASTRGRHPTSTGQALRDDRRGTTSAWS